MSLDSRVYELVARIPRGMVTTYGEIARAAGKPNASRAVGRILNKNPDPIKVPCHRVVRSTGEVGGYAHGPRAKTRLLESEGIKISKGKISDFQYAVYNFKTRR